MSVFSMEIVCVLRWTERGEKEQADGKVRRKPGEEHRWRMSRDSCVEWQAETWTELRISH